MFIFLARAPSGESVWNIVFYIFLHIIFSSLQQEDSRTCSKHLGAYVDQRNADNAEFFDDCVFDLCHGAGESAAEIAAELLASNQAIQTMTS